MITDNLFINLKTTSETNNDFLIGVLVGFILTSIVLFFARNYQLKIRIDGL